MSKQPSYDYFSQDTTPTPSKSHKVLLTIFLIAIGIAIIIGLISVAINIFSDSEPEEPTTTIKHNDVQVDTTPKQSSILDSTTRLFSDGSIIEFKENSFIWYQDEYAYLNNDNYVYGTYECYTGMDACNYATENEITDVEKLTTYFVTNTIRDEDFFILPNTFVLIFHNEGLVYYGEESVPNGEGNQYFGFYDGKYGDLVNVISPSRVCIEPYENDDISNDDSNTDINDENDTTSNNDNSDIDNETN